MDAFVAHRNTHSEGERELHLRIWPEFGLTGSVIHSLIPLHTQHTVERNIRLPNGYLIAVNRIANINLEHSTTIFYRRMRW